MAPRDGAPPLLEVRNLRVRYRTRRGAVHAVDGVSFAIGEGEVLGVAGESGCGKSTLVRALLRLLPPGAVMAADKLAFRGRDLLALPDRTFRREVLWKQLALVPQSAQNSLNPAYRVGDQIVEALQAHADMTGAQARERVAALFDIVGLEPGLARRFPHEFSGGMRQRAMIAMALALEPPLVIMDEPTTGLDVLVQERILRRIAEIRARVKSSILLITHDIAVIAEMADRIAVMYAGRIVEQGSTAAMFAAPFHPYTLGLQNAFPSIAKPGKELISIPGHPPALAAPIGGCGFAARCPFAQPRCGDARPPEVAVGPPGGPAHDAACVRLADVAEIRRAAREKSTWRS
ncbi:MAG: ABC transporter ATP-binding protein [Alphaproteobacteria bacterium]|nr:ABC transporter ATP-binding protein [Alphaproteobacteria bacterium]